MKKKVLFIAVPILIAVIIIAGVLGFLLGKSQNKKISTDSEWGDLHYEKLLIDIKGESYETSNGTLTEKKYLNVDSVELSFSKMSDFEDPVMLSNFTRENGKKSVIVYTIIKNDNNEKISASFNYPILYSDGEKFVIGESDEKADFEIVLLYNIKAEEYIWYIHKSTDEGESYIDFVMDISRYNVFIDEIEESEIRKHTYSFLPDEMIIGQVDENGIPIISKFEEIFIIPEIKLSTPIKIEDINNIKEQDLVSYLKTGIENYNESEEVITEDVKKSTTEKITELEDKRNQINLAKEEKKIAEAKAKKEAEEKAKAEEAKKGIKVGNYTIKYGTYSGDGIDYGFKLILKSDNTYVRISDEGRKSTGTWQYIQGNSHLTMDNDSWTLTVYGNNVIGEPHGAKYTWVSE